MSSDPTVSIPVTPALEADVHLHDEPAPEAHEGEQRRRGAQPQGPGQMLLSAIREFFVVVVLALGLSLLIKTFLVQAFYIPSGSMEDTLLVGDRVVVNKLVPGSVDLARGDIVVFSDPNHWLAAHPQVARTGVRAWVHDAFVFVGLLPADGDEHLIKRVIGLPGDHVACCDAQGRLQVNGAPLTEPYLRPGDVPSTKTFDITVPAGRLWVMGDHRSDSDDSRYHDSGKGVDGSVPVSDVTGRAFATVWPFSRMTWLDRHDEVFAKVPAPSAR